MSAGALMRDLKLHPRDRDVVATLEDRGRTMSAAEVAEIICEGKHSAKWVIQRFAPHIGSKPGREWLFYENEARAFYAKMRSPRISR